MVIVRCRDARARGSEGARRWLVLVLGWCLIATHSAAPAQSDARIAEYNIKAAFLYKFASYVEWPPASFRDEATPMVFGVIGADILADQLEEIVRGRRINDRPLRVRRLDVDDPVDGLHVLFVGEEHAEAAARSLYEAAAGGVLTVTESGSEPGIIDFRIIDDRVKFVISLAQAERGELRISARLLQVAQEVKR